MGGPLTPPAEEPARGRREPEEKRLWTPLRQAFLDAGLDPASTDPSILRRVRIASAATLGLFLLTLLFLGLHGFSEAPRLVWPLSLAALLFLASLLALRRWRRTEKALADEVEGRWRSERQSQAADRARGELLAMVGHEIRGPLSTILGLSDLLLHERLSPRQRSHAEAISASAECLLALLDDLLNLSKIQAGKLSLYTVDFRLREMLQQTLGLLRGRAEAKGLVLELRVVPDLPDHLRGDPNRLRQVLLNLVGNAIEFTDEGRVEIAVAPDIAEGAALQLRFSVRDTGVGIKPHVLSRLFRQEPSAGGSPAEELARTSLGLDISQRLVELMGGEIGCESTLEVGSTFWFRVPLAQAHGEAGLARLAGPVEDLPLHAAARARFRLLVVDDQASQRLVLGQQLKALGFVVETAADGQKALDALLRQSFDAVMMDCQMPGLDGYEATRQLRQREGGGNRTAVIAVTANAMDGERERCLAAGMDDYLAKPFRLRELAAVLDRWLPPLADVQPVSQGSLAAEEPAERAPEGLDRGVIDLKRLEMLRRLGEACEEDVFARVVGNYRRESPQLCARIRAALAERDPVSLERAAHSLAGVSGTVGAVGVADIARELEMLAQVGDLTTSAARIGALEEALNRFLAALAKLPAELEGVA